MDETKRKKPFQHRRYLKPLVERQYTARCKGCKKKLRDPADNPIYVAHSAIHLNQADGEYWCCQKCMDRNDPTRKEAIQVARSLND